MLGIIMNKSFPDVVSFGDSEILLRLDEPRGGVSEAGEGSCDTEDEDSHPTDTKRRFSMEPTNERENGGHLAAPAVQMSTNATVEVPTSR